MTHSFVIMQISQAAYDEIKATFLAAGYDDVFIADRNGEIADMHGIGVQANKFASGPIPLDLPDKPPAVPVDPAPLGRFGD